MDQDTDLGGAAAAFPMTQCALVRASVSPDLSVRHQAQHDLIAAYWKPVYKYLRIRWQLVNEDAKDVTQAFFAAAIAKDFFDPFDPSRARFRTFLRLCVDRFVAKGQRAAGCQKRGGGQVLLSLDFAEADRELTHHPPAPGTEPEDFFRREWVGTLFALAVEDLRQQCAAAGKETHFALFERYDLNPESPAGTSYAQLGKEFNLTPTQVTNHLAYARRHFRERLLDRLRATTGSDEEFQEEARRLLGGKGT